MPAPYKGAPPRSPPGSPSRSAVVPSARTARARPLAELLDAALEGGMTGQGRVDTGRHHEQQVNAHALEQHAVRQVVSDTTGPLVRRVDRGLRRHDGIGQRPGGLRGARLPKVGVDRGSWWLVHSRTVERPLVSRGALHRERFV